MARLHPEGFEKFVPKERVRIVNGKFDGRFGEIRFEKKKKAVLYLEDAVRAVPHTAPATY